MNRSMPMQSWLVLGCALAVGACTKALVLEDGEHRADAGASQGGRGGAGGVGGATGSAGSAPSRAGDAGFAPDGGDAPAPPPETRWTGNSADCPAARPEHRSACDLAEGQVCAYFGDDPEVQAQSYYSECACRMHCAAGGAELRWDCYQNIGSGRMDCPAQQPEHGSSCFGLKGYQCSYPVLVTCSCPTEANDSNWRCEDYSPPDTEHPTVVDPDKQVRDLNDDERQAWCEWYAAPEPGFPAPPELEPNADGFYPDTGCASSSDFLGCSANRPTGLPVSACVANLALSSCEATVRDLNDCALSMKFFEPSPFGCARYLGASGCSGTIINGHLDGHAFGGAGGSFGLDGGAGNGCLVRVR